MSDAGDSDESECMTSVEALKVLEAQLGDIILVT